MILCSSHSVKRNSRLFRALLHFLILATVVAPALAQVYKWVDERGVTHYGERPPQGAKATEVQDKLASPPPGGAASQSGAPKDQPEAAAPQPAAKDAGAKPRPALTREQVEAANRQQQCDQQRAILARLKEGTLNEKGEKVPYDNSEAVAKQEKRVIEQCR